MTAVVVPSKGSANNNEAITCDVNIIKSGNVQLGHQFQYYAPLEVQQYVTGLPEELAARPEVGRGLAHVGLIAAASPSLLGDPSIPLPMTLLLPSKQRNKYQKYWIAIAGTLAIIIIILTLSLIFITKSDTNAQSSSNIDETIYNRVNSTKSNVTLSGKLRIIDPIDWVAQPIDHPKHNSTVKYLLVTQTGGDTCDSEAGCKHLVQLAQSHDKTFRHLDDIGPNFMLAGDGYAYVGRGWNTANQCSFIEEFDANSICISFIGDFKEKEPSDKQLLAAEQLKNMAVSLEKLQQNYVVYGVRQLNPTLEHYPGNRLYEMIQTWDHWKECNRK